MIDWSQVDELKDEMGDGFDEVVEVFLDEVKEGLARLDGTASAEKIASDLHFLKGAALNLGFEEFASLCDQGETLANARQAEKVDLDQVALSYERSLEAFTTGLQLRAA